MNKFTTSQNHKHGTNASHARNIENIIKHQKSMQHRLKENLKVCSPKQKLQSNENKNTKPIQPVRPFFRKSKTELIKIPV